MTDRYLVIDCEFSPNDHVGGLPELGPDNAVEVYDDRESAWKEMLPPPEDARAGTDFRLLVKVSNTGQVDLEGAYGYLSGAALRNGPRFWGLLNSVITKAMAEVSKHLQDAPKEGV